MLKSFSLQIKVDLPIRLHDDWLLALTFQFNYRRKSYTLQLYFSCFCQCIGAFHAIGKLNLIYVTCTNPNSHIIVVALQIQKV